MPYTPSKAEAALLALQDLLIATTIPVQRNTPIDVVLTMGAAGIIILRDGEPGEAEITMSPLAYQYDHMAEVEVFAPSGVETPTAWLDRICQEIGTAIAADRTLGGAVDWADIQPGRAVDLPNGGEAPIHATNFTVMLTYVTLTPLT